MKKELLRIENGMVSDKHSRIFKQLYIRIFQGDSQGMVFDDAGERKRLIRLLKGELFLDAGRINFAGQDLLPEETPAMFRRYIGIIERDQKLIRSLSIEENIFLCAAGEKRFFVGRYSYMKAIERLKEELGIDLREFPEVVSLSAKERIKLEMVKNYVEGRKLIVFSNISRLLHEAELDEIFNLTLRMRTLGIGIIVIGAFDELMLKWTDEFLIVKNGKTLGAFESQKADASKIYELLLKGEEEKGRKVPLLCEGIDEVDWSPVLELDHVSAGCIRDLSLSVGRGEVVKIYYTDEQSGIHLVELLSGGIKPAEGQILLDGRPYAVRNIAQAVAQGICIVEEQAEQNMLLKNMSVYENIGLLMGEKIPCFWMRPRFNKSIREFLIQYLDEADLDQKLSAVEPYYLQQMIYYRCLIYHPKVVVCIKPFSQEDIHVRELTLMMKALCDRGIAVMILTAKFSDIHRIEGENIFIRNGCMVDEDAVYQFLYNKVSQ